jgi:hypothetical protein
MARPLLLLAPLTIFVLATGSIGSSTFAKTDPAATLTEEDGSQSMPDKIREKLSQDGYKDITVMPASYAVSATDKNGKPVLLLIGPSSATTLKEAPSTAESPPGKHERVQQ